MEIKHGFPPNIDKIRSVLNISRPGMIFTYGATIYVPDGLPLTGQLIAHESTHIRQQTNPELWWEQYLDDEEFRFDQELEAYRAEYKYCKENLGRPERRKHLQHICKCLSGPIYGNLISMSDAKELVCE